MIQQPAVPATTVEVENTSGQTAMVTVIGGTVTHIKVDGTDVATASNFTAAVAAGSTISITYSAAPTWYWSVFTPDIPDSGTAVANPTGQDITVVLASGTVTHIAVNGTDRGTTTPANVMLPAGESVTLTYSVAPVWAWMDFFNLDVLDSLGTAYAANSSVEATGVSGYSPANALPYASHAATGADGLGTGIAN